MDEQADWKFYTKKCQERREGLKDGSLWTNLGPSPMDFEAEAPLRKKHGIVVRRNSHQNHFQGCLIMIMTIMIVRIVIVVGIRKL